MKSEALHGPLYFLHDPHFSGSATPTLHPTTPARFKVSLSCHFFFLIKCSFISLAVLAARGLSLAAALGLLFLELTGSRAHGLSSRGKWIL